MGDPGVIDRAVAERVCAVIEPEAWVLDDTGVPKDGKHSPGVKRQYSGTLGKIGNCQIAVSLHAVGAKGTVPLGFRLYLPEDWCQDPVRRRETKIPADVEFATKPALGGELVARAAGWRIRRAPVLGDHAYGNDSKLRTRLHADAIDYVLSVGPECDVFEPGTVFAVPPRTPGSRGRPPSLLRADREPRSIGARPRPGRRRLPDGRLPRHRRPATRLALRVRARDRRAPRHRRPPGAARGMADRRMARRPRRADRLLDLQPAGRQRARAAGAPGAAALDDRVDYKQLKGELGLDHYEGRSYLGFHHHCALVTAAHGFLTLERADPNHRRPG